MKIFALFLLVLLANQGLSQELSCIYQFNSFYNVYFCYLNANNPNGLETIETITGEHLDGFTDANVTAVYSWDGRTTNIPSVICEQFPNLVELDVSFLGITTVGENALSGCADLEWLRFWYNSIASLPANVFANNPGLTYIDLDTNQLTTLPETVFDGLNGLLTLELRNNPFEEIPGEIWVMWVLLVFLNKLMNGEKNKIYCWFKLVHDDQWFIM
jgi:Leucine-rich repeat (LRR) protein